MTLVIPRSRTTKLGDVISRQQRFDIEMQEQGLEDIRTMIRAITENETEQQIEADNPPQVLTVDDRTGKSLDVVDKKAVVLFGVRLAQTAMRLVEDALFAAIAQTTTRRTGVLSDRSSWVWKYVTGGRVKQITDPNEITSFGPNDRLVLMPESVPYATVVNHKVARGGGLSLGKQRKNQGLGFLAYATRSVARRPEFRQFAIYVAFTKQHAVPGELSRTQGTGMLVIKPKSRIAR